MKEYQIVGREVIAESKCGVVTDAHGRGRWLPRVQIQFYNQNTGPLSCNTTMFYFGSKWTFVA